MKEKQKVKRRIRGAVGDKGKAIFIPFYVDLEKLKSFIESEKEEYLKARIDDKLKALNDQLDNLLDK